MNQNSLVFRTLEVYGTRVHHRGQWLVHEKLRGLFGVNVDTDLEVERGGLRWVLNPADHMQSGLFWLDEQDRWELYHIRKMLEPGALIFDVGANFGYYSLMLASALGGRCQVHAFEPNAKTYLRLTHNVDLNGMTRSVLTHRLGLSDMDGKGTMVERADNSGAAWIEMNGEGDADLTTLDAFCEERSIDRLDFIKVDIEGFEERMLLGGSQTLQRHQPPLLVELNPSTLVRQNSSAERIAELLRSLGYALYEAQREKLAPLERLPQGEEFINAFCLPSVSSRTV